MATTNDRSLPLHRRVMIPLLTLQYLCVFFVLGVVIFAGVRGRIIAVRPLVFGLATLGLLIYESITYRSTGQQMKARTFFSINLSKLILWTIELVISIVVAAVVHEQGSAAITIIIPIIIFLIFLGAFIYACVVYSRSKKAARSAPLQPLPAHMTLADYQASQHPRDVEAFAPTASHDGKPARFATVHVQEAPTRP